MPSPGACHWIAPLRKLSDLVVYPVSFSVQTNPKELWCCRHGRASLSSKLLGWFVTGGLLLSPVNFCGKPVLSFGSHRWMLSPDKKLILSQMHYYVIFLQDIREIGMLWFLLWRALFAANAGMGHRDLISLCCGKSLLKAWLCSNLIPRPNPRLKGSLSDGEGSRRNQSLHSLWLLKPGWS